MMARQGHAVLEFGGYAPNLPPFDFRFEQIAERTVGGLLLELMNFLKGLNGAP